MSERHEIPKPDAVSPDDWDAMLDALERRHAARAASGLTLLTAEQRAWIERYTSFKTDASPITKAMRKALAIIDSQAAALAAEEKNCIAFHEANQKQIAIIQEQRAALAERDMTIHEQLVIIATLEQQLADKERECERLTGVAKHNRDGFEEYERKYYLLLNRLEEICEAANEVRRLPNWENRFGHPDVDEAVEDLVNLIGPEALNIAPAAEGGPA